MKQARIADANRLILSAAALCMVLSCVSVRCFGLPSSTRVSQLAHTAWRVQDGAFTGTPSAIAQTMDGYLWIGTNSGLTRVDGVRFVPWVPPSAKGTTTLNVITLLGSKAFWSRKGSGTEVEVVVPAANAYADRRQVGFSVWIERWSRRLRLQADETSE